MTISRPSLLLLCSSLAAGCVDSGRSFELTLTRPDGTKSTHSLSDDSGFSYDGSQRALASWPDIAEWNTRVPVGASMYLVPLQAGRYTTSGNLHLGDGTVATAKPLSWTVKVDRVKWQNNGSYPFRWEGSAEGTSPEGHRVEGRFSASTDDCADKVRSNNSSFICGFPFPSDKYTEQTWSIANWQTEGDCPAGLLARYGGGKNLVLDSRQAKAGGERSLQCVVTYANAYRVICGANEENLELDGCKWGVTALAYPGAVPTNLPAMYIVAGTTDDSCPQRFCTLTASGFTHVSGAQTGQ
ncbi:MAG TPA: hypothetical protein VFZ09_09890 [Archangium sp.]|uniref:hypothetical protein n=1 Tax=Archangium sp. TaxID=1872627 RepID=UPI002E32D861|nr:hypothetical protein [Archangium sp.]HEX5746545.1 hypothetical protein [Archangium sp.]